MEVNGFPDICVSTLCVHIVCPNCASTLCVHIVCAYCVSIFCVHILCPHCGSTFFPHCAFKLCVHIVCPYCQSTLCVHIVRLHCVSTLCVHTVSPHCASTLCVHILSTLCVHIVRSHCVHIALHEYSMKTKRIIFLTNFRLTKNVFPVKAIKREFSFENDKQLVCNATLRRVRIMFIPPRLAYQSHSILHLREGLYGDLISPATI